MTCREVDSFFDPVGGIPRSLPADVAGHMAECRRCTSVHGILSPGRIELGQPAIAIQQRVVRELTAGLHPVKPAPGYARMGMLVVAIVSAIVLLPTAIMGARALPLMTAWQIVSIAALLTGLAVMGGFSLACQHTPGSRHVIPPGPLIAASLALLFGMISLIFPWSDRWASVGAGLRCSIIGLMIALPAAALLWFVLRRGVVLSPEITSASLGLMGGITALAVLQLNCRIVEASHILVWHMSVVLLMMAAGSLAGALFRRQAGRRSLRSA